MFNYQNTFEMFSYVIPAAELSICTTKFIKGALRSLLADK